VGNALFVCTIFKKKLIDAKGKKNSKTSGPIATSKKESSAWHALSLAHYISLSHQVHACPCFFLITCAASLEKRLHFEQGPFVHLQA
jgi:hypothetical protein